MKKSLLFFILSSFALFFLNARLMAQVPQLFNYQGIARDASGNVLPSRTIGVQLSVLQGSAQGGVVYSETFTTTTNAFGLFTIQVGGGNVTSGTFAGINWGLGNMYLQTSIDLTGGSNYSLSGTTQLLSVPYALYAQSAVVSTGGSWSLNGNNVGIYGSPFIGTTNLAPLQFDVNNQFAGVIDPQEFNTLLGQGSIYPLTSNGAVGGVGNVGMGYEVLGNNANGGNVNTAVGTYALYNNTTGTQNVAIGGCTYAGGLALPGTLTTNITGSFNTAVGTGADVSVDGLYNATAIGYQAVVNANNKVRIGNGNVTVIEGQVPFTTPSDGRFKFNVQEDVKGLDFILRLRPVTYQFNTKKEEDFMRGVKSEGQPAAYTEAMMIRRTGFIAQEVERAAKRSGYDFDGLKAPKTDKEYYSLSYASFVVPLVKAVQEQQEEIRREKEDNRRQQQRIDDLTKEVEQLRQLILTNTKK